MSVEKQKHSKDYWIFVVLIVLIFVFMGDDVEDTEPIVNSGTDKYTLMVYMCGSDLESSGGYASDDIEEMMNSQIADEINLLIYTGGANSWYNNQISSSRNQIFKVEKNELKLVNDNIGLKYFSKPDTLYEFLNWSKKNYPADKYGLVFWDHGGGAVSGFGFDEKETNENESLTIDEIKLALDKFDTKLEFVGFDACLMANFETAYALKDWANYFIASEEAEPGSGWEYSKVINQLSKNTSQNTVEFGKVVVDSFISANDWLFGADATLSIVDLRKIDNVYNKLISFMKDIKSQKFDVNDYYSVSRTLKNSKAFADGQIDTVDLMDFSNKISVNSSSELTNAIKECVSYNKTTTNVENSNGLSIYFPNEVLNYYDKMLPIYKNIGFSNEYINIMNEYVNIIAGGTKGEYTVNNNTYQTGENFESYSWYDTDLIDEHEEYYNQNEIDVDQLEVEDRGDYYALHLTDEQWDGITNIGSSVWYDDGEGYIDLGIDSYFELDDTGDLKVEFDGTWVAINGNIVRYEVKERTDKYEKGYVHALLNGEEVNLVIYYDKKHPDGEVLGAEPIDAYGDTTLFGKGYIKIKKGDEIDFIFDYYDYDGTYNDQFITGDTLTVGKDGLTVSYEWIGDGECLIYYILTDMYNNKYYTEPVIVY